MDPFTIVLLAMLGFAVLLVAGIGRRAPVGEGRPALLPRLVAGGARLGVLLATLSGLVTIVLTLIGDRVTLAVPAIARIETVPAELRETPEASIVDGAAQQSLVLVTVTGLDLPTRVLAALQVTTLTIVAVTLLALIARVARQSTATEPFSGSLPTLLSAGGSTLAVGGMLAQVLGNSAGSRAHEQLFRLRGDALDGGQYIPAAWSFDLWPIGVGLVIIVMAQLMRSGERLQRETEGLV